jgi:two-component system sensor histidine kinase/response regulator
MTPGVDAPAQVIDLHRADEQRLNALIGQDMACVLELSLDARVLRVNDQFCRLTGFPRDALLGRHLSECVPPEDWPSGRVMLDGVLEGLATAPIEVRLNCAGGGLAWVSCVCRLVRTEAGEPVGLITLLLDISASMQMRERLILAEERLRLALDGARMGVWSWGLGEERLTCSHVALACLGMPPGAEPGFDEFLARVHPEDREQVESGFRAALASLEPLEMEFRIQLPDGTERWLAVMARASLDPAGQHGGMQGLVGDVSQRKTQELLLASSLAENLARTREVETLNARLARRAVDADTATRTREALLRNVGHEFRTPLNHICGSLDILLSEELPPSQRRWIVTAREAADALTRIVEGVMDVARLAAGEVHSELGDFAPGTVLNEVAALLARRARARELTVLVDLAPDVPQWVLGDGAHVAQALLNYFDNAIKFTPSGTVTLAVRRVQPESAGLRLRFEVQDTGIGIRQDVAERLFKPFVQGDDSITRPYGGLGIGLSNARELAELMGGTAGVDSRPGGGSIFWLDIPVQPASLERLLAPGLREVAARHVTGMRGTPAEFAQALASLPGLRAQLRADDMHARDSLRFVADALRALVGGQDFERLCREVEGFDFPAALLTLDRIERHLAAA